MDRKISLSLPGALRMDEEDAYQAMQKFGAYLDITPSDFRELYAFACEHVQEKLLREVTARDIMTAPPLLLHCGMTLRQCIDFLEDRSISGAPVTDGEGVLAGIVSEKDIVMKLCGVSRLSPMGMLQAMLSRQVDQEMLGSPVENIMTRDVFTVKPDTPLAEMLRLMHEHAINRLPVLDGGHVAGIVTRTDLLKVFGAD